MKKYQVYAHSGLAWPHNLGEFDSFEEAQDALNTELDRQLDGVSDIGEILVFSEMFWFDSRIDEINEGE